MSRYTKVKAPCRVTGDTQLPPKFWAPISLPLLEKESSVWGSCGWQVGQWSPLLRPQGKLLHLNKKGINTNKKMSSKARPTPPMQDHIRKEGIQLRHWYGTGICINMHYLFGLLDKTINFINIQVQVRKNCQRQRKGLYFIMSIDASKASRTKTSVDTAGHLAKGRDGHSKATRKVHGKRNKRSFDFAK